VKLGVQIADYAWDGGPAGMGEMLATIARTADDAGFDVIGVADHLWQGAHLGGPEQPELECFTTLGIVSANTRRCRLVPLVAGVHFRQPAMLAKIITTLDVLSGGRAMLGIGAGWYEEEARGLGIPFPPLAVRFEMLEEAIQICLRMWQGDQGDERPFTGKHYHLDRPLNAPQSLARPHPPILIGGGGERKTLRLVARYGDACNLYPTPDLPAKLDALRRHCEAEGRDYDAIEKTCMVHFAIDGGDAKTRELIGELHGLGGLGIETVIGILSRVNPIASLETIRREVIPVIADA
jgi:F420-dependent oxidoreductase-like protein